MSSKKKIVSHILSTIIFVISFAITSLYMPNTAARKKNNNTSAILCEEPLTPENTEIHFDLDDTIIKMAWTKVAWRIVKEIGFVTGIDRSISYLVYRHKQGIRLSGPTLRLVFYGITHPHARSQILAVLKQIHSSHYLIPGVLLLINRLKEKGYTIVFATNKDRVTYDNDVEFMDGTPLKNIADKVLVYQPPREKPFMQQCKRFLDNPTNINDEFRQLVDRIYNVSESDNIFHANIAKDSPEYVKDQRDIAGDKCIIFFDDKKDNVKAVKYDPAQKMFGFQADGTAASIAAPLKKLGILSENDEKDRIVLAEIKTSYCGGVFGRLHKWWNLSGRKLAEKTA